MRPVKPNILNLEKKVNFESYVSIQKVELALGKFISMFRKDVAFQISLALTDG